MNIVYKPNGIKPLNCLQLAQNANAITPNKPFSKWDFDGKNSRISGVLCDCNGNGRFELLPITDEAVQSGGKRYMKCRKCGCYSHL